MSVTVTARFRVRLEGWVTITRRVPAFDPARADSLDAPESDILDSMADEAVMDAGEHLDGRIDDTEVLSVTP